MDLEVVIEPPLTPCLLAQKSGEENGTYVFGGNNLEVQICPTEDGCEIKVSGPP